MRKPTSMDECAYFTIRNDKGVKAKVWVLKEICPECKKGLMAKPKNPKTGRPKIRALEYECNECHHIIEKQAYEDTLTANIEYECQCGHKGEIQIPFKRKKMQKFDEKRKRYSRSKSKYL